MNNPFEKISIDINADNTLSVNYDIFSDIAGGISLKDLKAQYEKQNYTQIENNFLANIEIYFKHSTPYLYLYDTEGLLPLEILSVKVYYFINLLKKVRALFLKHKKPHLFINPNTINVSIPLTKSPLPSIWSGVLNPAKSLTVFPENIDEIWVRERLFKPDGELDPNYSSPEIRNCPFMADKKIDSVILEVKITLKKDDKKDLLLKMVFLKQKNELIAYKKNDIIYISLNCNDPNIDQLHFWGIIDEIKNEEFIVSAFINETSDTVNKALLKRKGSTFFDTPITLYKSYNIFCDIYSLGKTFLINLLKNKSNNSLEVNNVINNFISVLNESYRTGVTDMKYIKKQLLSKCIEKKEIFTKNNILFYNGQNQNSKGQIKNLIPDDLWNEILILSFRLITQIDGFSYCREKSKKDDPNNITIFDNLTNSFEEIYSMLYVSLFRFNQQKTEILQALQEEFKELQELEHN